MTDFFSQAYALFEYTRALRRDFHRNPELGFNEFRTAGIVANELNKLGLEVTTGIAKTGVAALLEGARPGPVILLRFDMDALPIQEETGAEYTSRNPGVMHACGHDGHTAVGLTVARILAKQRDTLPGVIKFVFQPAEEGMGGAETMIAEGILENPQPEMCLGLHFWNNQPFGWLGISSGPVMAASEIFSLLVKGKGGHGALPNLAVDPVVASAHIITALQSIIARNVSPLQTAVITVATVHGGEAHNVIPENVRLTGTIRTFDPEVRQVVLRRFTEVIQQTATALGCQVELELKALTPAVLNDPAVTQRVRQTAEGLFPDTRIASEFSTMGSEDMACFMERVPGCYFFIGSANAEKGLDAPHHHPRFDIEEEALPVAAALMSAAAVQLLENPI